MVIIIIVILVIIMITLALIYNNLIKKKNATDNAYFSMDVMLKKRYDQIPQLVETVKGYMNHEKGLLTQLTELRQKVMMTSLGTNDKVELDNQIGAALQTVFVSFENYPQLKASENFLKLQGAINETEEQLAASRRFYNAAVNEYHNGIEMFPSSVMASWMGLRHKTFFQIADADKAVPASIMN